MEDDIRLFIQNEVKNLAFKNVGFGDSLIKSKLLDSITLIDLIVSIEEKTGIIISQHLINEENFDTIDKIAGTLSKLK